MRVEKKLREELIREVTLALDVQGKRKGSKESRLRGIRCISDWIWYSLHRWRAAWNVTGWRKKKHLNRGFATRVCYTIRGVLGIHRSE